MQKYMNGRPKIIICCLTLGASASAISPAESREIQVNGLPCNELCQAWLGYATHGSITRSISENIHPVVRLPVQKGRLTTAEPLRSHRPKTEVVKTDFHTPIAERPTLEPPKVVVSPEHVRSQVKVARETKPLPVSRPTALSKPPTLVVTIPAPLTPRPSKLAPQPTEAATVPDRGTRRAASLDPSPPAAPERSVDTTSTIDKPYLQKNPARGAPPTSALASTPASPSKSRMAAASPIDDARKQPSNTSALTTPSIAGETLKLPSSPVPLQLEPASQVATVEAALPSSVAKESAPRTDGRQSKDMQEGALQPSRSSAGDSLSVKIGQVSAEPRGTDVHVVVVNVLPKEMKDIDVRCRARDAQGLQVAEVSTRIANVAPSDVTFERILFPSEITPKDNTFTCEVEKMAATDIATP